MHWYNITYTDKQNRRHMTEGESPERLDASELLFRKLEAKGEALMEKNSKGDATYEMYLDRLGVRITGVLWGKV
ncbi:hypothetical protein [Pseudomonas japonica]|uniref:hypothetical protein n=1 Tax=Pseudomonas japonica TaxID=256466 RepID=UPI0015E2A460|nr:hypothetical protein [Pseudomonas japonica]MBA1242779.1 hypothetical protein [Pseudomonas japonica]MBA1290646.1 hypothetical protein [Pseudomonas japonica]